MEFKIRGISSRMDRQLRIRARAEGKSLNDIALQALTKGLKRNGRKPHNDLDWFFGAGKIDKKALKAMADHDVVNPDDWK